MAGYHFSSMGQLRRSSSATTLVMVAVVLALMFFARAAIAAKVIPPGKESTIRAMMEPYGIGQVVRDGFVLHDLRIDRDHVVLSLLDETDASVATLTLAPRESVDVNSSASFSFTFAGDEDARVAADVLADSIRARDQGDVYVSVDDVSSEPTGDEPDTDQTDTRQSWSAGLRALYLAKVAGLATLFVGVVLLVPGVARARPRGWDEALAGATMVAALMATAAYAWTCADATISLRYASHLAAGQGLVFNLGERVQGFTNPLWTLGLALGALWGGHLVWATHLGVACSAAALAWLWSCTRRLGLETGPEPERGANGARFAAVVVLTFGSQPFLAFSTSGLENSATHMLVAACLAAALADRPRWVLVAASLALLNRLDTAPLVGPLVAVAYWRSGATTRERFEACWPALLGGVLLLCAWFGFATIYYGYPLPNTWYAKGGLHVDMGLRYLGDFITRRPSSAIVLFGGPLAALVWSRSPALRATAIGVLLQVAYVVCVGGDYMHGRFFTAALMLASVCLVAGIPPRGRARTVGVALVVALAVATTWNLARVSIHAEDRGDVFLIERDPEFALWNRGPVEVESSEHAKFDLEDVAISNHLVGQVFGTDPRIQWIDGYGLTDPYVARCPIIGADPRPGHAERLIPRAYLQARGDVRQLRDGRKRLDAGDPSLGPELAAMRANPDWPSEAHRRCHEELELLTRGPIFDPERLRLIPVYTFGRPSVPAIDPGEAFDVLEPD
jgi:arabinofuranosyltransferase